MPASLDVVEYLEREFLAAINNDLVAIVTFHDGGSGGFHSVPREVFCYIDYVSAIWYGPPNSSAKAIQFIEKFLGQTDVRYRKYGKLLYEMWRHGTVHEFDPKTLQHSTKRYSIGWQTNNDSGHEERACHLECFKIHGMTDRFVLNVNLFQLVDDFIASIRLLIDELKSASHKREVAQRNYTAISRRLSVKELSKSKALKRSLNLQITRAIKMQRFEVQDGNVLGGTCT